MLRDVLVELPVEAEAADAPEAVALRVVELLVEELAGLLQLRRVAGAEARVDLEEGVLVAADAGVLVHAVEDQHVDVGDVRVDDLHLGEVARGRFR